MSRDRTDDADDADDADPDGRPDEPAPGRPDDVSDRVEDAIRRVDANANREWKEEVYAIIRDLAATMPVFNADHVWQVIDATDGFPSQHEPSALGAVVRKAVRDGLIRIKSGAYVESQRPGAHAKPMRVWESCRGRPVPA